MQAGAHNKEVVRYYSKRESRWGYRLVLGGTRHFGYYSHNAWLPNLRQGMLRMEDELGRMLNLPKGACVLDAGCGEGNVAAHLSQRFGLEVKGVDLVADSVRRAQRWTGVLGSKVHFQVGDYTKLPFSDGTFDAVYTMETLVHAEDYHVALAEFRRVLKPGGRLVCFEYSLTPPNLLSAKDQQAFALINQRSVMTSFGRFLNDTFPAIFEAAGFDEVAVEDLTIHIWPMLRFFCLIGWMPYMVARLFRVESRYVNVLAGVELYRMRTKWRYNAISCRRP